MRIATSAYPLDWLDNWAQYEDKIGAWVSEAAEKGADLLVFPEYAAMELSTLAGRHHALDLEHAIKAVSDRMGEANAFHAKLAREFNVHILGASAPVEVRGGRPVNRAMFFASNGQQSFQDKQIMTRFEREDWRIASGEGLRLIETSLGKIAILICYDSEFPLLGRALSEADVILVPSCTEGLAGYSRVRIGAMARALENQCVTAMASIVGKVDWSEAVDVNTGMGGVFAPPDRGFPNTGVLAEGQLNQPGWTYADVDLNQIADVRKNGGVLNRLHWQEQDARIKMTANVSLV